MGTYQRAVQYSASGAVAVYERYYTNSQWYPWVRVDGITPAIADSGTYSFGRLAAGASANTDITFASPLPSNRYMVLLETQTGLVTAGAQQKTTTGFKLFVHNVSSGSATATVNWAVLPLP